MAEYLKTLLLAKLQNKTHCIICSYYFILETNTKTTWLDNFLNKNTYILICTNMAGIGVNILNVKRVIQ